MFKKAPHDYSRRCLRKALNAALCVVLLLTISFCAADRVFANSIGSIDMDVYIDADGNAHITEVWNASLSQGTEGYRAYSGLENSSIYDFSVTDDTGRVYENIGIWDVNASFDNKAYKCGVNYIGGGLELCWGISEYGDRVYTLTYIISDFVIQCADSQVVYFNFLNLDQSIGQANIKIRSDIEFSVENSKIWAFGYNGTILFNEEDGSIVLDSGGSLSTSQYMVALVKFEDAELFNTSNISDKSFDDIYNEALVGVPKEELDPDYNQPGNNYSNGGISRVLDTVIPALCTIGWIVPFVLIFVFQAKRGGLSGSKSDAFDFGPEGKTLPLENDIPYWREIPCNKDLAIAHWVADKYIIATESTLRKGIVGAILLKWIKQGFITLTQTKKRLFSIKDNNYAIDFNNMVTADNDYEIKLLGLLREASGSDYILEAKEFEKWCKRNYMRMEQWFEQASKYGTSVLETSGLITVSSQEVAGVFGIKRTVTTRHVNPSMKTEAIRLRGLKKFLLEFSLIHEKEHFEVHIWEEYLIFAQLLGIADKVEEQFSKLYPNFNQVSKLNTEFTTVAMRNFAFIGYQGMVVGRQRADSYSSGGGFSGGGGGGSFSGGGGSSGGSSGGGFR